jgi:hypothetical protein
MTTHRITLLEGWYQVVETGSDGSDTSIGSFRTEADAQDWLNAYLRMQTGAEVFKVGYSELPSPRTTKDGTPVAAPKPN